MKAASAICGVLVRAVAPRNSISVAMLCVNASLVCDSLSEWAPLCDYRISLCSAREAGSIGASAADRYAFCVTLFAGVWEALPHAPLKALKNAGIAEKKSPRFLEIFESISVGFPTPISVD